MNSEAEAEVLLETQRLLAKGESLLAAVARILAELSKAESGIR